MNKEKLKNNIKVRIADKTEEASITVSNVSDTLNEIVDIIDEHPLLKFPKTITLMEDNRRLPNLSDSNIGLCILNQAGVYEAGGVESLTIADGELALAVWDGINWDKYTIRTLAQDGKLDSKDAGVSQHALHELSALFSSKLRDVKDTIPSTDTFLTADSLAGLDLVSSDDLAEYLKKDTSNDTELGSVQLANTGTLTSTDIRLYDNVKHEAFRLPLEYLKADIRNYVAGEVHKLPTYSDLYDAVRTGTMTMRESEALVGVKDGVNSTFTTTRNFVAGSTAVYLNGQRYFAGVSYTEVGANSIKISDILPEADDVLMIEAVFE